MPNLQNLKPEVKKWWESFTMQANEHGFDFENSAIDRMLLMTRKQETFQEKNYGMYQGAFLNEKYTYADEMSVYDLDAYPKMQDEPTEENINKLYEAASKNEVIMFKKNAAASKDFASQDDFFRIIGVNKNGEAFIGKTVQEMRDASPEGYDMEYADTVGGGESARETTGEVMRLNDGIDYVPLEQKISDERMAELIGCDPSTGDCCPEKYHLKRLELFAGNGRFKTSTFTPSGDLLADERKYISNNLTEDLKKWTGATDKDLENNNDPESTPVVYDNQMKPVNYNNKQSLMAKLAEGLYICPPGDPNPHRMEFHAGIVHYDSSPVVVPEKPRPVPKPNGFVRFFHNVTKFFGGKGFDSCNRYDEYKAKVDHIDKLNGVKESRQSAIDKKKKEEDLKKQRLTAKAQSREAAKKMQQNLTMQAANETNPAVKDIFEKAAHAYGKLSEERVNYGKLAGESDSTLTCIAGASMIMSEREAKKTQDPTNTLPGPVEAMAADMGSKDFLKTLNRVPTMRHIKQSSDPASIRSLVNHGGMNLKQCAEECQIARKNAKQVAIAKEKAPEVSAPSK